MASLEALLILILTTSMTCNENYGCISPVFQYGYQQNYYEVTENATCEDLDQMHITSDLCSYRECTITILGENGNLKSNTFARMKKLEQVYLNDTKMATVENKAFSGSPNIKLIHLERNEIARIPQYIFSQLEHLEYLDLHDNRIEEIEEGAFDGCISLSYLDLSQNKLQNLSSTLLGTLVNLKTLNISSNSLDIQHQDFCNYFSLENLILDHNQISSMQYFTSCLQLKSLSLAYNNLKTLNNLFFPSLEYLNLSTNHITTIENNSFQFLNNLLVLDISNNNIQYLPFELFDNLKNLSHLDLSFNNFTHLDDGVFSGLINLIILNLRATNLNYLESRIFYATGSIQLIDLSDNRLTYFDLKLLSTFCRNLVRLIIDGNHFTCPALAQILLHANQMRLQIAPGQSHGIKNMNGIACFEEQESSNGRTPNKIMDYPENSTSFQETNLKNFKELMKMQKNLLRIISSEKEKTSNYSGPNEDIKHILSSLNDVKILLVICTFIAISFCIVKLFRQLQSRFTINTYVMKSQELPFIERKNTQSI